MKINSPSGGLTFKFFKDIIALVTSSIYLLRTGILLYFGINTAGPSSGSLNSRNFDVSGEKLALKFTVLSYPEG